MKKFLLHLFLSVLLVVISSAGVFAQYKKGYYDKMDGTSRATLKKAAKECVQTHTMLEYYSLPNYWITSDVYPDRVNGQLRWWDMYSDEVYLIRNGQSGTQAFSANKMQREHSVPKSWWKVGSDVEYTPAYSDMWNLYPSDGPANQAKLNYPLGETRSTTFDNNVTKVGSPKIGQGGGAAFVFEPADEYKGDFARSFFYMAVVYDQLPWCISYMFKQEEYPTLQPWAINMLLQWARFDQVSQKEIDRNNAVEKSQGNRNPFVDFPELAEYIWGTRTEETFYISEQGGNVTPPITGDTHITMPVDDETLDFGAIAQNISVTSWLRIKGENLRSPLSLTLGGKDRACFKLGVKQILPSLVNGQDYYDFPIVYTPSTVGRHEAVLVLYDGGLPDGTSITVNLVGEGKTPPVLNTLTATAPTNVSSTSYTANWTASDVPVDYYIITRTRYDGDDVEVDEYQTQKTSYDFIDRNPDVTETYSVRSWSLGVESEESNTVTLAATGVEGIMDDAHTLLFNVDGGVMLAPGAPESDVEAYDISGRLVKKAHLSGGDTMELDHGIYVVICGIARKPLKIVK